MEEDEEMSREILIKVRENRRNVGDYKFHDYTMAADILNVNSKTSTPLSTSSSKKSEEIIEKETKEKENKEKDNKEIKNKEKEQKENKEKVKKRLNVSQGSKIFKITKKKDKSNTLSSISLISLDDKIKEEKEISHITLNVTSIDEVENFKAITVALPKSINEISQLTQFLFEYFNLNFTPVIEFLDLSNQFRLLVDIDDLSDKSHIRLLSCSLFSLLLILFYYFIIFNLSLFNIFI